MIRIAFAAALALALAACGGKARTGTVEHVDTMAHAEHEAGEGDVDLPPTVAAFHDHLAPLWHMAAGAARTEKTCGDSGSLDLMLEDIEQAGAPDGVDAATWMARLGELRARWSALAEDCVSGPTDFEARFAAAHDAFHALIALLPVVDR